MEFGIRLGPALMALGLALLPGTALAQAPSLRGAPAATAWPPGLEEARRAAGPTILAQALRPAPTEPPAPRPPQPAAQPGAPLGPIPISIQLQVGGGRLLQLPQPALTVLAADPRIARVQPASPTSLFLMAVGAGRTTVVATAEDGTPVAEFDITVQPGPATAAAAAAAPTVAAPPPAPGASAVQSMIRRLVRGADRLTVTAAGPRTLVLAGELPTAADAQRAETIARTYGGEDREVVNNLTLLSSIQVNLRVRVAEISRQISRELGFNWDSLANNSSGLLLGITTAGSTGVLTSQVARRLIDPSPRVGRGGFDINAVVDALASDQLITILAEPNLTAQSGEVASFLAGGEFPVPIAASPVSNTITIEYKQFGVSLAFVPTVLGPDRLNLRVRPEVSELSENGAISLPLASGVVRIPALNVRRAETTVELGSGQSFAIAGLLQHGNTMVNNGVNGLRDIPVLGALFGSDRYRRNETELVIIITPYLVRPVSDPQALAAPTDGFRPATDLDRILFRRQIARGAPGRQFRSGFDAGFIID